MSNKYIQAPPPGLTSAENVGVGTGTLIETVTADGDLKIKTLAAGSNISITNNSDNVTITSTGGGGGGDSFTIMQPDSGTSPTASSSSDTLTFTSSDSSVSITGDSAAKSLDFKAGAGNKEFALTPTGSIAIDFTNGNSQHGTLSGNTTISGFSNGIAGSTYVLKFTQPTDKNYTISWPTLPWLNSTNTAPRLIGPGCILVVQLFYDGANFVGRSSVDEWDPGMLSGLILDVDFSDPSQIYTTANQISQVDDKSSSAYPFTPLTSNSGYVKRSIQGLAAASMIAGTNDYFENAATTGLIDPALPFDSFFIGNAVNLASRSYAHAFVLGGNTGGSDQFHVVYSATIAADKYVFFGNDNATTWPAYQAAGASSLASGWHMLEISYNGSGATTLSNFVVNVDNSPQIVTTSVDSWGTTGQTTWIGGWSASNAYSWNGLISRIFLYNRVLSSPERSQIAAWRFWKYGF